MPTCPDSTCAADVPVGAVECFNCGYPMPQGEAPKRSTRIGSAPAPAGRPKRQTVIGGGGPVGSWKPSPDPFAVAVQPAPVEPGSSPSWRPPDVAADAPPAKQQARPKRKTMLYGADGSPPASPTASQRRAAIDPNDPFAAALQTSEPGPTPGTAAEAAVVDRPLVGSLVSFSTSAFGQVFPFRLGRTVVGRRGDEGSDIALDDGAVSTPHCTIISRPAGTMLQDKGSSNGTFHKRGDADFRDILSDMVVLEDGDLVRSGQCVFLVQLLDRTVISQIWPDAQ